MFVILTVCSGSIPELLYHNFNIIFNILVYMCFFFKRISGFVLFILEK